MKMAIKPLLFVAVVTLKVLNEPTGSSRINRNIVIELGLVQDRKHLSEWYYNQLEFKKPNLSLTETTSAF